MFIGKYYHTLESKGRVSLPKSFRHHAQSWVVTRGLDGGLFLFTAEAFTQQLEELAQRPFTKKTHRDFIRLMTNEAQEVKTDGQGRVQLPEYLIEFAALHKEVVIIGSYHYLEIWDRTKYHQYLQEIGTQAEALAENYV